MNIQNLLSDPATSAANIPHGQPGGSAPPSQTPSHAEWTQAPGVLLWKGHAPAPHWGVEFGNHFALLKAQSATRLENRVPNESPQGAPVIVQAKPRPGNPQECETVFSFGTAHLSLDTAAFAQQYSQPFMDFIRQYRPIPSRSSPIQSMPTELLFDVATRLSLKAVKSFRLSNRRLSAIGNPLVRNVKITNPGDITALGAALAQNLSSVKKITLSGDWVTDASLQTLSRILSNHTGITELDLSRCKHITKVGLAHVASLRHLTHLNLSGCEKITNPSVGILRGLKNLQHLDMSHCQLDDNAFTLYFKKQSDGTQPFSNLTHLNLSGCTKITKTDNFRGLSKLESLNFNDCKKLTDIEQLQHLQNLRSLSFQRCKQLNSQSIEYMRGSPGLTSLDLHRCDLPALHLVGLGDLSNLEFLDLSGATIPDGIMAQFNSMSNLADLRLQFAGISYAGLNHLQHLANSLKKLDLSMSRTVGEAKAAGVPALGLLTNLTSLNLLSCDHVGATDLPRLQLLSNLEHLNLSGCSALTDATLQQHVVPLQKLVSLEVSWCPHVTEASIPHLMTFPKLKTLHVNDSGLATSDKLWELRAKIPNVTWQPFV
jgi:Ran GTPase-activating protein (RanGAP) involved in mRNA processing and transport